MSEAPQIVRVDGNDGRLFRDGDPPIYLIEATGQFAARLNDRWVKRTALTKLEKVILANGDSVKLMRTTGYESYSHEAPEVVNVSQMTDSMVRDDDGKKRSRCGEYYLYDKKLVDELTALEDKKQAFMRQHYRERKKIMRRAKRVHTNNFKQVLAESLVKAK